MWKNPLRQLATLLVLFVGGVYCMRILRFTLPLLNYIFVATLLCLPFVAIWPLSRLRRWGKVAGFTFVIPVLLVCMLLAVYGVACDVLELHHGKPNSCIQEVDHLQQGAYTVHLLRDCGGGATVSWTMWVQQEMPLVPGLQLVRTVDSFYGAYEGKLSDEGMLSVRLKIPRGVEGSGWNEEIDRVYKLKPHVYF